MTIPKDTSATPTEAQLKARESFAKFGSRSENPSTHYYHYLENLMKPLSHTPQQSQEAYAKIMESVISVKSIKCTPDPCQAKYETLLKAVMALEPLVHSFKVNDIGDEDSYHWVCDHCDAETSGPVSNWVAPGHEPECPVTRLRNLISREGDA